MINVETFCALFLDYFRPLRTFHKYSRQIFLAFGCLGFYLVGLIFVTKVGKTVVFNPCSYGKLKLLYKLKQTFQRLQGGVYVFEIFNTYGMAGWSLFFIAACECIAIGWVYGADRHWDEINRMIGPSKIRPLIIFIWKYVGPILCMVSVAAFRPRFYCTLRLKTSWLWATYEGHIFSMFAQTCRRCPFTTLLSTVQCLTVTMSIHLGLKSFVILYQQVRLCGYHSMLCIPL